MSYNADCNTLEHAHKVISRHHCYSARWFMPLVKAVIVDSLDRILLVQQCSDLRWVLPSGKMVPDESAQESVERITKAYTGLRVTKCAPFIVDSGKYVKVPESPDAQIIVFGFRVREWSGDLVTQTFDTLDAGWFTVDEAYDVLGHWADDVTTIDDHICTDYDPPAPADGSLVWVR